MSAFFIKTGPRLLQDICDYNFTGQYREFFEETPVKSRCQHVFTKLDERSVLPAYDVKSAAAGTRWCITLTCQECRCHLECSIDFPTDSVAACPSGSDAPLHNFCYRSEGAVHDDDFDGTFPRRYAFACSEKKCKANVAVVLRLPVITDTVVLHLRNTARLRLSAVDVSTKQKDPLQTFKQYVTNSLDGKARNIPAQNKVFSAIFGSECNDLLFQLGFSFERAVAPGGSDEWSSPNPGPHNKAQLQFDRSRMVLEDCREELLVLLLKSSANHFPPPPTTKRELERILGCSDYDAVTPNQRSQLRPDNDLQLSYRALGAMPDFSDWLISWCYDTQSLVNPHDRPLYFQSLKQIAEARGSEKLGVKAMTLESQGEVSAQEINKAFWQLGIDPAHANTLNENHIVDRYYARLPSVGAHSKIELRQAIKTLARATGHPRLQEAARDHLETYDQALEYLGVDASTSHEFVWSTKIAKDAADPTSMDQTTRAIEIIQRYTKSDELDRQLRASSSSTGQGNMDLQRAQAVLGIEPEPGKNLSDIDDTTIAIAFASRNESATRQWEKATALKAIGEARGSRELIEHARLAFEQISTDATSASAEYPRGLQNWGATCYLNSLLQLLYTVTPIRTFVLDFEPNGELHEAPAGTLSRKEENIRQQNLRARNFVLELKTLFSEMLTSRKQPVSPRKELAALTLELPSLPFKDEANTDEEQTEAKTPLTPTATRRRSSIAIARRLSRVNSATERPALTNVTEQDHEMEPIPSSTRVEPPSSLVNGDPDTTIDLKSGQQETHSGDHIKQNEIAVDSEMKKVNEVDLDRETPKDLKFQDQQVDTKPDLPPRPAEKSQTIEQKVADWAQQNDMREVLANAFLQLSQAFEPLDMAPRKAGEDAVSRLIYGEIKIVDVKTNDASQSSSQTVPFNSIFVNAKPSLKDMHSVIEEANGCETILTENEDSEIMRSITFPKLPPILQFEVSSNPVQNQEDKRWYLGPPLKVEPLLYMDRYADDEHLVELRRSFRRNIDEQMRLQDNEGHLKQPGLSNMNMSEALGHFATYLESISEDAEDLGLDQDLFAGSLVEDINDIGKDVSHDLARIPTRLADIAAEQAVTFPDQGRQLYRIHAVCMHLGKTAESGHYTIYIYDNEQAIWWRYNDDKIEKVTNTDVLFHPSPTQDEKPAHLVYVLDEQASKLVQTVCRDPAAIEETGEDLKAEDPQTHEAYDDYKFNDDFEWFDSVQHAQNANKCDESNRSSLEVINGNPENGVDSSHGLGMSGRESHIADMSVGVMMRSMPGSQDHGYPKCWNDRSAPNFDLNSGGCGGNRQSDEIPVLTPQPGPREEIE